MRTSKCFTTNGSKMENKLFVVFSVTDISDGISWKFRIAKIAPTFTAEALAIGETLEIIKKNRLGAKFCDFLRLGERSKRISNTSTMSNTSHITQILIDKTDWNREGKYPILLDPWALWS
jgi:hypothetical protein